MQISKYIYVGIVLLLVYSLDATAQNTKKEIRARYKEMASLPLDSFKGPKFAYLADELSIEDFVVYYVKYGKLCYSKDFYQECYKMMFGGFVCI